MGRGKKFIMDALPLALAGVILRAVTVSFNAHVAKKLGAQAMGLYGLVMSVGTFGVVLASSGVNLATVRLTAAAQADGADAGRMRSIMRKCAIYSLIFGGAACVLLLSLAGILGRTLLSDARVIPALRAFALSLPAISLSSALAGYFTGTRRIARSVLSLTFDQLIRVLAVTASLILFEGRGIAISCLALVCGGAAADWLSLLAAYALCRGAMRRGNRRGSGAVPWTAPDPEAPSRTSASGYQSDPSFERSASANARFGDGSGAESARTASRDGTPRRREAVGGAAPGSAARKRGSFSRASAREKGGAAAPPLPGACGDGERRRRTAAASLRDVAAIAIPVAFGAYLRTGLTSLEHIAIPWGLRRSGCTPDEALASYGVVSQMALPAVLVPYAVIGAFTSLLVPEMTALSERGDAVGVRETARRVISLTVFFGVAVAGAFSSFGRAIGTSIYASAEAGAMIRMLAPIMPVMFLDTAVDSMLKGLGEQVYCAKVNTIDAAICLATVLLAVPRFGVAGYIAVIYASEAVNAALSIARLTQIADLRVTGRGVASLLLAPLISLGAASLALHVLGAFFPLPNYVGIVVYALVYLLVGGASLAIRKKRPAARRSANG